MPSQAPTSDADLVALCRAGDQGAWGELVQRFAGYVHAIAARGFRLGDHDAEDVFQEVFARLYEHLGAIRDDAAIRSWIAQTTRRLAIDRIRTARRERPSDSDEPSEPIELDAYLERLDEALTVREALSALPEHCQEVLTRFFMRDQSYVTISQQMDLPSGTIASRISRCLGKARDVLEGRSEGVGPSGESER